MLFLITGKAIDVPMVPPPQAIAAYKATYELFASGTDRRVKGVWPHADERAATLLVDVDSGDDLSGFLVSLPAFFLSAFETHPVASVDQVLRELTDIEQQLAGSD
jgi:muconolactone delta-isomerase